VCEVRSRQNKVSEDMPDSYYVLTSFAVLSPSFGMGWRGVVEMVESKPNPHGGFSPCCPASLPVSGMRSSTFRFEDDKPAFYHTSSILSSYYRT
jgi:hypothetical protein